MAKEFWENEKNPHVTKDQIEMFKEAKRIYKEQQKEYIKNTHFKELRL